MSQTCVRIVDYNYVFDSSVDLLPTTENSEFPASNVSKFHRAKVWRTTSATSQALVFDLKTAESIDTFVMVFDPLSSPTFSSGTTFTLQASATNVWTAPPVSETPVLDEDAGVIVKFMTTAQEYRYWRILINDASSTLGYFEVSKIILGLGNSISQPPSIGFTVEERDQSSIIDNEYGHEYADSYPGRRRLELEYKALTDADRDIFRELYQRNGRTKPILIAVDPLQATFLDKDDYVFYGFLSNDYEASQSFYTFFDIDLELREAM